MSLATRVVLLALAAGITLVGLLMGLRFWTERRSEARIYDSVDRVPPRPVALVLGAGLWPDGSLTPILTDRVATAADLYRAGKVPDLISSGEKIGVD